MTPVAATDRAELVYSIPRTGITSPNIIFSMDIVGTAGPEIVVTDVSGMLRIYDALTGTEVRTFRLTDQVGLTAPVIGSFTPRGSHDIAVGTSDGRLMLISGSNFEILSNTIAGTGFSVQPMVFPSADPDPSMPDMLVMVDGDGMVYGFRFTDDNRAIRAFQYRSATRILAPPTYGTPRQPGVHEIVTVSNDGFLMITNPETSDSEKILVRQPSSIQQTPLLFDITDDGRDEIFIVLQNGDFLCLEYRPNAIPRVQPLWSLPLTSSPIAAPLLLQSTLPNQRPVILQASDSFLHVIEPIRGRFIAEERTTLQGINTQLSLIPAGAGYPQVAFGLKQTIQISNNLPQWIASSGETFLTMRSGEVRGNLTEALAVVRQPETSELLVVGISPGADGRLVAYRSGVTLPENAWPTNTPWNTAGGSGAHRGRLDKAAAEVERLRRNARQADALRWREELDAAIAASDWTTATELSNRLVAFDPFNNEFRQLRRTVFVRANLLVLVLSGGTVLLLGGYSGYRFSVMVKNRSLRKKAKAALKAEDHNAAAEFLATLAKRLPRDSEVAVLRAKNQISLQDFSEEAIPIFRAGHNAKPDDRDILHGFARALLLEPKCTDEAAAVYTAAAPTYPDANSIEYGLGCCAMSKGDYEEAGRRIRNALRGGLSSERLYSNLCEIYLRTNNTGAKTLPIYQQQHEARRSDPQFLKAYLAASIDAKKADGPTEALCAEVLDADPSHLPAHLHLAAIHLQKNQPLMAVDAAREAIRVAPEDPAAIRMLATCLLVLGRRDDEALAALRRGAQVSPDDRELHNTLADILREREDFSPEAIAIYRRAHQIDPDHIPVLEALASAGERTGDMELVRRSLEALSRHKTLSGGYLLQLAKVYSKLGNRTENTERVLREAVRLAPNDSDLLRHYAAVLCALDRQGPEIIPVLERYLETATDDVEAGRQLARTYLKNERYEEGLALTNRLLTLVPNDEEIQRLHALASLYDNKIDEAVSEYEALLARNPDDNEALVNLALAFSKKQRNDDDASAIYLRALTVVPDSEPINIAQARVHLRRGEAVKAVENIRQVLRAYPDRTPRIIESLQVLLSETPDALRLRWFLTENLITAGQLREALEQLKFIEENHPGQTPNLLRALESILARDPNNFGALLQRGGLLHASGQLEDAMASLQKAHKSRPADEEAIDKLVAVYLEALEKKEVPEIRFRLGRLFFAQQEYDAAIGCFQKTASDYRWEGESTKMLGKCFTGKGMLDLALQEYKKLVVDNETKDLLYDLAQRYEAKKDLVGAKTVYRQLFAADIDYKDVRTRFEMLSGSTSDPATFERTAVVQQMSEQAALRYQLLDELGRGAMGLVYRAKDKELDEVVALKILPDNMSKNPEAVRRFKIEARNARKLSHPHIVRIHDIGEEMGRKYISMEYVDGSDLKKRLKSLGGAPLPTDEAIGYAIDIADALAYAHRLGIVHRDIKPANIMLTAANRVKVTDFGIAKLLDADSVEGTMVGAVIGTPLYMSPEQVQGIPVDNRADLYSFGVMLYEFLSGRPPFTEGDLAYQHMHRDPDPIEGLDPALWAIVSKCLAKKKEDRWENAEQIVDALKALRK